MKIHPDHIFLAFILLMLIAALPLIIISVYAWLDALKFAIDLWTQS